MKTLLFVLLLATPAAAQEPSPAWDAHRQTANWLSTGTVLTSLTLDTVHSFRSDDRRHAFTQQALRTGLTIGVSEVLKRVIHRDRPDHSNRLSFPSEHTALAVVSSGWRIQVSFPLALGTGYFRTAAAKHYPTDVLAGAGIGALFMHLFH